MRYLVLSIAILAILIAALFVIQQDKPALRYVQGDSLFFNIQLPDSIGPIDFHIHWVPTDSTETHDACFSMAYMITNRKGEKLSTITSYRTIGTINTPYITEFPTITTQIPPGEELILSVVITRNADSPDDTVSVDLPCPIRALSLDYTVDAKTEYRLSHKYAKVK